MPHIRATIVSATARSSPPSDRCREWLRGREPRRDGAQENGNAGPDGRSPLSDARIVEPQVDAHGRSIFCADPCPTEKYPSPAPEATITTVPTMIDRPVQLRLPALLRERLATQLGRLLGDFSLAFETARLIWFHHHTNIILISFLS